MVQHTISLLRVSHIETGEPPSPDPNYDKIFKSWLCFWKLPSTNTYSQRLATPKWCDSDSEEPWFHNTKTNTILTFVCIQLAVSCWCSLLASSVLASPQLSLRGTSNTAVWTPKNQGLESFCWGIHGTLLCHQLCSAAAALHVLRIDDRYFFYRVHHFW